MADWETVLQKLVRKESLMEGCFSARPPKPVAWPRELPSCPELMKFYSLCDGSNLGCYDILPQAELVESTASLADWLKEDGQEDGGLSPGRWLNFGHHEYGFDLIWDEAKDAVTLFNSDGNFWYPVCRSMAQFF